MLRSRLLEAKLTGVLPMRIHRSFPAAAIAVAALVATLTLAGGAAANASPPDQTTSATSSSSCWIDLTLGESLCVPAGGDLVGAVLAQDDVSIQVPDGLIVGGAAVSTARVNSLLVGVPAPAVTQVVSAIYDDINYGGGTLLLSATSAGCDWGIANLGGYGWNDRASSFKSFNGCTTALYQNINYAGTRVGFTTNKASFGTQNDQGSSWATE
jgi:hypothetical protein